MRATQEFRQAQPQDLPGLYRFYQDTVQRMNQQGIDQWDDMYPDEITLREDVDKQEMYMLTDGDELVAAVVLNEEQDPHYWSVDFQYCTGRIGVIHRLCVGAGHQGKGYGKQILQCSEEFFRKQGYSAIRLDAFPQNAPAIRLYTNMGYRRCGRILLRKGVFHCFEKLLNPEEGQELFFACAEGGMPAQENERV